MNKDNYSIDYCQNCKQFAALKNGYCKDCQDKQLPDFFKDMLEKFNGENHD